MILQKKHLESPVPVPQAVPQPERAEQRISIIDTSILVAQDNSDENMSTQQTSDQQQSVSEFKLKNQTIQENSQPRLENAEIDFSQFNT